MICVTLYFLLTAGSGVALLLTRWRWRDGCDRYRVQDTEALIRITLLGIPVGSVLGVVVIALISDEHAVWGAGALCAVMLTLDSVCQGWDQIHPHR